MEDMAARMEDMAVSHDQCMSRCPADSTLAESLKEGPKQRTPKLIDPYSFTKVLAVGGNRDRPRDLEIVSIQPGTGHSCPKPADFPRDLVEPLAALVNGLLLVCNNDKEYSCLAYHPGNRTWTFHVKMDGQRRWASSVSVSPSEWWIAGGMGGEGQVLSTSIVVTGREWVWGPGMPDGMGIYRHCIARSGDHFYLAGGERVYGFSRKIYKLRWRGASSEWTDTGFVSKPARFLGCAFLSGTLALLGGVESAGGESDVDGIRPGYRYLGSDLSVYQADTVSPHGFAPGQVRTFADQEFHLADRFNFPRYTPGDQKLRNGEEEQQLGRCLGRNEPVWKSN